LRAAIVNSYGTVLGRRVQPTPRSAECPDAVVEVTGSLLKRDRTAKAGIGVPGCVSYSTGQLEYAPIRRPTGRSGSQTIGWQRFSG
jgi:predicted NBD/HSP70 family sugar kinase